MTTKSSAYLTSTGESPATCAPVRVASGVADSSGFLHPVQRNVEQHRADHPALRSSLLGRGKPSLLDHAGAQPPGNHSPGGKRGQMSQSPGVVDAVERL